jgi:methyltransferase-like protein
VLDDELLPGSLKDLIQKAPERNEIVGVTAHEGLIFTSMANPKNSSDIINSIIEDIATKISYSAKTRGVEAPITIESFKNLYGINDMMLKDKRKARITMAQIRI